MQKSLVRAFKVPVQSFDLRSGPIKLIKVEEIFLGQFVVLQLFEKLV
jgi:hypothetical protein